MGSIAGLRIVSCPAAVLETAFHVATALLQRSDEEPLLREAVEGLVAVIPQYLAPARKPATPPTPARLRPAPEQTAAGTGRPLA